MQHFALCPSPLMDSRYTNHFSVCLAFILAIKTKCQLHVKPGTVGFISVVNKCFAAIIKCQGHFISSEQNDEDMLYVLVISV